MKLTKEQIQIAVTVDEINKLEYRIKKIISNYLLPENKNFTLSESERKYFIDCILFNSDVLEFGKKVKLFFALILMPEVSKKSGGISKTKIKKCQSDLFRLLQIRNIFAHTDISSSVTVKLDSSNIFKIVGLQNSTRIIKANGTIVVEERESLYIEFTDKLKAIDEFLFDFENNN